MWHNDSVYPSAAPVATGGRFYLPATVTSGSGTEDGLCCIDAATGELIWLHHVDEQIDAPLTVVTDSRVLMAYGGTF